MKKNYKKLYEQEKAVSEARWETSIHFLDEARDSNMAFDVLFESIRPFHIRDLLSELYKLREKENDRSKDREDKSK